jgi:hypothetical protein
MTKDEFTFWVRGFTAASSGTPYEVASVILSKAKELLVGVAPIERVVPELLPMRVGDFCAHNKNVREPCDACSLLGAVEGVRVFAVYLPVTTKQFFVAKEKKNVVGVDADGGGGSGAVHGVDAQNRSAGEHAPPV